MFPCINKKELFNLLVIGRSDLLCVWGLTLIRAVVELPFLFA